MDKYANYVGCQNVKSRWISYTPVKENSEVIGIGSNYRFFRHRGTDLWIGAAAAVNATGSIRKSFSECDLNKQKSYAAQMWAICKEAQLCKDASTMADCVVMDGSIHSKMYGVQRAFSDSSTCLNLLRYLYGGKNVVFVSKIPLFMPDNDMGDAVRCAKANRSAGFGVVCKNVRYGVGSTISTVYARLEGWSAIIMMEMFGDDYDEFKIMSIMDHLTTSDLSGQPYVLRQIQRICKIDASSIDRICRFRRSTEKNSVQVYA